MPILNDECVTPNDEWLENQQLATAKTFNLPFVFRPVVSHQKTNPFTTHETTMPIDACRLVPARL
jgi:hypothetical protein